MIWCARVQAIRYLREMGLHVNLELGLPATLAAGESASLVELLREHALTLPFTVVTDVVRLTEVELVDRPQLLGPLAMRVEDVARFNGVATREALYARAMGIREEDVFVHNGNEIICQGVHVPRDMRSVAYGFSVAVGPGCEPASLGVLQIAPEGKDLSQWWWQCSCKTQYASVHGDENLLRCHRALVDVLDAARSLGFEVTVHDETGYWESRDTNQLLAAVERMNKVIAHFAAAFTDAAREAGHDSRGIQAEIFGHPDFERLEMGPLEVPGADDGRTAVP